MSARSRCASVSSAPTAISSSVGCVRERLPDAVEAEVARQLRQPRLDRAVVAQPVEPLVRAREDLLEDVLRVVLGQPEPLHGDRVHVAGEPLDELPPGAFVAGAAARDELGVGELGGHAVATPERVPPSREPITESAASRLGA